MVWVRNVPCLAPAVDDFLLDPLGLHLHVVHREDGHDDGDDDHDGLDRLRLLGHVICRRALTSGSV